MVRWESGWYSEMFGKHWCGDIQIRAADATFRDIAPLVTLIVVLIPNLGELHAFPMCYGEALCPPFKTPCACIIGQKPLRPIVPHISGSHCQDDYNR